MSSTISECSSSETQVGLTVQELTRGQEVSGIWRVKGWKRNFLVLRSMATFTMDLDAGASPQSKRSLAFFFQKNPIVSKKQWSGLHYESIECTEWLSLCVTLQSGGPPCAFILTVEKLSVDYQVIATLLPAEVAAEDKAAGGAEEAARRRRALKPPPRRKKKKPGSEKPERSLLCLGLNNPLRRLCYAITEWKTFEHIILLTILGTCVSLAMSTTYPNDDSDLVNLAIEEYEIVFTVIFTLECFMNIIAQGLIAHEGSYLRGGVWNILDFIVVFIGLLEPILSSVMEGFDVKALRAFRVLRPLKLVSNVPPLQVVMNSILMALIPLFNIALLILFVMAIYAIIGLDLFLGQLHHTCFHNQTGEMMKEPSNCGGGYNCENEEDEFWECRLHWEGPNSGITNFDNIGLAMLTVYQCISLEGWTDVMYNLQDAMGSGSEWVYFVSMVFFGAFFTMNLILGVLSGEFGKQKEKVESRGAFLREREQRQVEEGFTGYINWITSTSCHPPHMSRRGGSGPVPAEEPIPETVSEGGSSRVPPWRSALAKFKVMTKPSRRACRVIIKSQTFYWIIIVLVFLNTMVLATEHYRQPQWLEDFQDVVNVVFVVLFTGEMVIKLYSYGFPVGVSVLRCARLLRLFKVTKYWGAMLSLVGGILASLESIASLLVLLYLFIMIFALLGMQMFGGKFSMDPTLDAPRTNFDSFSSAMLTVFQILTGEDWNEVMYLGIKASGGVGKGMITPTLYFVVVFTLGNYILLNVFLAIAVDGLEAEPEVEADTGGSEPPDSGAESGGDGKGGKGGGDEEAGPPEEEARQPGDMSAEPIPEGSSFFILSQTNPFRVLCHRILANAVVSGFLLICILVSSSFLAAEDPVYDHSPRNQLLGKCDYFFTTVFTIELALKLIVYGVVLHPGAFCRAPANLLDLLVVGVSLASIIDTTGTVEKVKILRVCRVLRPLRAVNRSPGLKRVFQAMIVAIKTIGNIVIVTGLLEFMYAVIGVQLFKGALFACSDASKHSAEDCRGEYLVFENGKPVVAEREWMNNPFNFDSVPKGMLTLFAVSTFEGWPQMLYKCIDAAGEDKGPVHNNRLAVAFFYISFLVVISFYMINIFVGFVILTFQTEGEREYEHCDMEKNQRDCLQYALKAKPTKKYSPTNHFQRQVWSIVSAPWFDNVSLGLVCLNTVSMTMKFYRQPEWYSEMLAHINIFFTVAFTVEFVLKFVALGPREYCRDAWNVFDLLIVIGSYVDIIFSDLDIGVIRLSRAGRLVKLLNKNEGLRTILWTFVKSLQALPYVVMLLVLLFFIFSIIGMQSFAKVQLDDSTPIHRNNNFQSFGNALLLLFRCATGESWQDIMMACVDVPSVKCFVQPEDGDGLASCGSNAAYPYFIAFVVSCQFLCLNLLVAVIMDNFDYLTRDWSILGAHHLGEFVQQWMEFDPEATGRLRHEEVINLLKRIQPPLGFGSLCPRARANTKLMAMNMPMNSDGTVSFNSTLFSLVRTGLQIRMEGNVRDANQELRDILVSLWKDLDPELLDQVIAPSHVLDEMTKATTGKFYACVVLQQRMRKWSRKRKAKELGVPEPTEQSRVVLSLRAGVEALDKADPGTVKAIM